MADIITSTKSRAAAKLNILCCTVSGRCWLGKQWNRMLLAWSDHPGQDNDDLHAWLPV